MMTKIDPIIAVKDVDASSNWYQQVFGFRREHGGKDRFAVLVSENDEILLCLHKWEEHEHPTMTNPTITPGNGLILYFRTENMNAVRQNIEKLGGIVEEDIHLNPSSLKKEFSLRDPDGYYLTITEFHKYDA
jgi:predicted enzyme related to lactoylglutathione lyase